MIVLRARPGSGGEGPAGLPPSLLTGLDHGRPCLVMPDPDGPGRLDELAATLAGWTGAVGPSVPAQEAGTSLLWARRALDLAPPAPSGPDGPAPAGPDGGHGAAGCSCGPRSTCPACCCARARRSPRSWPPGGWPRWTRWAPGRAGGSR
ncbi:hypothetical protein ACFQY7_02500 [Actinomadura luteofluorescens]|uniref:hypothetical protein n=1 Tax=Actinomadura luteofluorescens TaxID=46163 RepID=UPI003642ACB5